MAGSQRQKTYFTAWCLMAGLDPDKIAIEVVPFSLSPALPEPTHPGEPQFVMAGYNWPWLKGQRTVETVSRELTRLQRGHLHVYSMAPPFVDALPGEDSSDDFAGYMDVQDLSRVTLHDPVSFDELTSVLCRSSVALDVWGRNLERELAFPTRTVVYLWCGLPVIVSAYSEAYDLVRRYDAGWAMAESDQGRLGKLVEDIVCGRINLRGYKTRAQRLAGDHFLWDKTIESIDAFCRNPVRNRVLSPLFVNRIELEKRLEESLSILEASRRNNDALREDLKKSENVRLDLHREKEAIAGKYAHLEAEAVRMSHLNRHLLADSRLMGRVYRRPKGFARFTSLTLFRLTWKRLIIGLPVLGYLFCLAVGGQFLQNLHLRWKRS